MQKHIVVVGLAWLVAVGFGCDAGSKDDPPPSSLSLLATLKSPGTRGSYDSVAAVGGKYLYAGLGSIHIYDLKSGKDATEVGVFASQGSGILAVRGSLLFYTNQDGSNVADISDPTTIKHLKVIPEFDLNALRAIYWNPTQKIVASTGVGQDNEVVLYDLTNAANPEQVGRFFSGGQISRLAIDGNTLYVSLKHPTRGTDESIEIWDVTNVAAASKVSSIMVDCGLMFPVAKGIVYCGESGGRPTYDKPILDARDPANPTFPMVQINAGSGDSWFSVMGFLRMGSYVLVNGAAADVKDPLHPAFLPHASFGGLFSNIVTALAYDDRFIYSANDDGAYIFDRRGP